MGVPFLRDSGVSGVSGDSGDSGVSGDSGDSGVSGVSDGWLAARYPTLAPEKRRKGGHGWWFGLDKEMPALWAGMGWFSADLRMAHLEVNHANFGRNFVLILKGLQSILITGGLTKFSTSTVFGAKVG